MAGPRSPCRSPKAISCSSPSDTKHLVISAFLSREKKWLWALSPVSCAGGMRSEKMPSFVAAVLVAPGLRWKSGQQAKAPAQHLPRIVVWASSLHAWWFVTWSRIQPLAPDSHRQGRASHRPMGGKLGIAVPHLLGGQPYACRRDAHTTIRYMRAFWEHTAS